MFYHWWIPGPFTLVVWPGLVPCPACHRLDPHGCVFSTRAVWMNSGYLPLSSSHHLSWKNWHVWSTFRMSGQLICVYLFTHFYAFKQPKCHKRRLLLYAFNWGKCWEETEFLEISHLFDVFSDECIFKKFRFSRQNIMTINNNMERECDWQSDQLPDTTVSSSRYTS